MILYHGTDKKTKRKILKKGFEPFYGEYGTGVYLAKDKDLAYDYGDEIIEVWVDEENIFTIDIKSISSHLEVEYIAQKKNYPAVCITKGTKGSKDWTEICVYDTSIIEIN